MRHSAAARTLGLPLASVFACFIAGDCPGRELAMDDSGLRCRYNVRVKCTHAAPASHARRRILQ